jgi:hypothetical protein
MTIVPEQGFASLIEVVAGIHSACRLIYIHEMAQRSDWTWGCVALENEDIEELYQAIPVGTPVTIKP